MLPSKQFNTNKSEGPTDIPNFIIKNCQNGISKFLFILYNQILKFRKIPKKLKISSITPIFKKGKNKSLFISYRKVSVQPNIYRIFESILLKYFLIEINAKDPIPNNQYSYTKGISLYHQHIDIQYYIYSALQDKDVMAIDLDFLDLSNAFDTIPYDKLNSKLRKSKLNDQILSINEDSFKDRKQFVAYEDVCSRLKNVNIGIPQGGVFSPINYNKYVSDMPKFVKTNLFQFADDSLVLNSIRTPTDIECLQTDLDIYNYCKHNDLILNTEKSVHLRISLKKSEQIQYNIDHKNIESVECHKHLGVIYDSKMSFNKHYIVINCLKKFAFLKKFCNKANGQTFVKLYKTYIQPLIETFNLCWTPTETQSLRLEKV